MEHQKIKINTKLDASTDTKNDLPYAYISISALTFVTAIELHIIKNGKKLSEYNFHSADFNDSLRSLADELHKLKLRYIFVNRFVWGDLILDYLRHEGFSADSVFYSGLLDIPLKSSDETTEKKDYSALHKKLADKFKCSSKVIKHIRSAYYERSYKDVNFRNLDINVVMNLLRKDQEKKLVPLMQCWRAEKLDFIADFSKNEGGLQHTLVRIQRMNKSFPRMMSYMEKVAFRRSVIGFLKRLHKEQFKEIISTKAEE
jgi:hypothetical protein